MEFLVLFGMLFLIEVVSPEEACVGVNLIFFFAVQVFKCVRTKFTLFGFET